MTAFRAPSISLTSYQGHVVRYRAEITFVDNERAAEGSLGTITSTTVTGLAPDGSTVWVRLWYKVGGKWRARDFQYTAFSGADNRPNITNPAPGSTLAGSSQLFQWTANNEAVTAWWLYAGTEAGGRQYHNSGSLGTSTSHTVTGLPTDGTPVWVRLNHKVAGVWRSRDFPYTAAGP